MHAWTFPFLFLGDHCQIFQLEKVRRGILNANGLWQVEWLSGSSENKLLCPLSRREGGKVSALSGRFIFLGQVFFEVCRWQFHLHLMSFRLFPFCCAKHLSQLGLIWWGHAVTLDPLDLKWNHLTRKERGCSQPCSQTFDICRCAANSANYPLASLALD